MFIKINLLGERKKKGGKTILWLSAYGFSLLFVAGIFILNINSVSSELTELEGQQNLLEAQLNKLKVVTNEVRELSAKKKNLAEKIAVMAALRKKKTGPVKVMDDLNFSIPERAWITEVKELEGSFLKFSGYALDFETISLFLKNLEASDYFSQVDLIDSKKATVKGITITEFVIQGKVSYLGKLIPDQAPIEIPTTAEGTPSAGKAVSTTNDNQAGNGQPENGKPANGK